MNDCRINLLTLMTSTIDNYVAEMKGATIANYV